MPGFQIVATAGVLGICAVSLASAQQAEYEYAGKLICGPQVDSTSQAVTRGFYATTINVMNGTHVTAHLNKYVVWTLPPATATGALPPASERPTPAVRVAAPQLAPGQALAADCMELERLTQVSPTAFHEGMIMVTSDTPVDILGVYTAAPLVRAGNAWFAGQVSSLHIDRFSQRLNSK